MSFKTDLSQTLPGDQKAAPRKIGNYEIMGVLGQGQSATIYLGRELFPAREVAIKVYDPHQFGDDTKLFRSLFLKETLLAKKLTHPGITQIYDAAADDERAYIVMEYMQGGSPTATARRPRCSSPSGWRISWSACATRFRTRTRTESSTGI